MDDQTNTQDGDDFGTLWILLAVVVGVQVIFGLAIWNFVPDDDRGAFGDMFGAVNTLFSGLAFAGVVYAILLQRKELSLQRQELTMTRAELTRAAAAHEASVHLMREEVAMMRGEQADRQHQETMAAQPDFVFVSSSGNPQIGEVGGTVRNEGAPATEIVVEGEDCTVNMGNQSRFGPGQRSFGMKFDTEVGTPGFTVSYTDANGTSQTQTFEIRAWNEIARVGASFMP